MQHRIAQCKPEMQFRDTAVQGRMYNVLFPFSLAGISLPCPLCNSAVASLSNTSTLLLKRNTFEFKCRDTSLVGVAYIECFIGHQCMYKWVQSSVCLHNCTRLFIKVFAWTWLFISGTCQGRVDIRRDRCHRQSCKILFSRAFTLFCHKFALIPIYVFFV